MTMAMPGNAQSKGQEVAAQKSPFNDLRALVTGKAMAANLAMVCAKHLTPDRIARLVLSAASRNPKIMQCSPASITLAMLNSAACGLEPDGYHAHIVPFSNRGAQEATFIPDYKGLIQLMYRSGQVASVACRAVYEKDQFEFDLADYSKLRHIPTDDEDAGELVYAWADIRLANGGRVQVVLNKREVLKHRAASSGYKFNPNNSPWTTNPAEMWAKTAIRVASKFVPRSIELTAAVRADNLAESGDMQILDVKLDGVDEPEPDSSPAAVMNMPGAGKKSGKKDAPAPAKESLGMSAEAFAEWAARAKELGKSEDDLRRLIEINTSNGTLDAAALEDDLAR